MPTDAENPILSDRTPSGSPCETIYQDIREAAPVGLPIVPDRHQRTQTLVVIDSMPAIERRAAGAQDLTDGTLGTTRATTEGPACGGANRGMLVGSDDLHHRIHQYAIVLQRRSFDVG